MLPNYLIIGAGRSGTTWLAKNIMMHPDIFMPRRKEIHFFDQNYHKGIEWYKETFKGRNEKAIGEATPAYLYFKHIPELIYKHIPKVKLIVSLRNPVERAYSHYWNLISNSASDQGTPDISFDKKILENPRLVNEGKYVSLLNRYYDFFSEKNILVLLYDDIKKDPNGVLRRVYGFLNVDSDFTSPIENHKINASSTNIGKLKILNLFNKVFFRLKLFQLSAYFTQLNQKKLPMLDRNTQKTLFEKHYINEICELEIILNRDLSSWKSF